MATERTTNGTFTASLAGWTAVEDASRGLGLGPPANGSVAWSPASNGCAQVLSVNGTGLGYDGALYQAVGQLEAGATYRLALGAVRRTLGASQSDDQCSAGVWLQRGSADPVLVVVVTTEAAAWLPQIGDPTPTIRVESLPVNADESFAFDDDVSHFVSHLGSGSYTLWLRGTVKNSTSQSTHRNAARFDAVSLLDFSAPADVAVPTRRRVVVVSDVASVAGVVR
jgi:hypothetical protein